MRTSWLGLLFVFGLLAACGSHTPVPATAPSTAPSPSPALPPPIPTPVSINLFPTPGWEALAPADDSGFASNGGGEPRTAGYWLLWNSCTEGNKADVARANGGRTAGWILLDDLLEDPGVRLWNHLMTTCEEGVSLL